MGQYQYFGAPKMGRWAPFLASEKKKNCFAAGQNLGLQKRPPKTDPKRKNCFVSSAQYQCFGAPKMGRWAPFLASEKKKLFRSRPKSWPSKKAPKNGPKKKKLLRK